ncbi:Hypothetical protein SRAE_1000311500 [Strongyloides ratti]|uniref:Uncharacterized protein n=1 Tax=Strongyloides ratti TaxID=34506 RepID=A0A090L561_STRRB|nr:Hypothetical protein SRAE_1000311500 [Strongyloides ratti]CEF64862.1 Hypothetical protein SRAE_1000311500 [Strongyloides ratti]
MNEIPFKVSKKNDHDESILNMEIKNESKKLSGAEIVGRNMQIMNLIISNIHGLKDRKNVALTCKAFYLICIDKESYVKRFKKFVEKRELSYFINDPLSIIFEKEIIINLTHFSRSNTLKLEAIGNIMKMNRHIKTDMVIRNLPNGYFPFFKNLNCFENIKTIYFDSSKLENFPLAIFKECSSLQPITLIFGDTCYIDLETRNFIKPKYSNDNLMFPKSIKHIHLDSKISDVTWLKDALKCFENYELESLIVKENVKNTISDPTLESIASTLHFFKKVKFIIRKNGFFYDRSLTDYFGQTFAVFFTSEEFEFMFEINFDIKKCNLDFWINYNRLQEKSINDIKYALFQNVLINERYLCINSFGISRRFSIIPHKFNNVEIQSFKNGFRKLRNLTTLKMDISCINIEKDFKIFCCSLTNKLKNVSLYQCDELKLKDLIQLVKHCPYIENIRLEDVRSIDITIKKIISLFVMLKGLEIDFSTEYNFKYILADLVKKDNEKNQVVLDWPQITYLNIFCKNPDSNEIMILDEIEKKTPRKSGKFLITKFWKRFTVVIQIIIQNNTNYLSYFDKIFDFD